MGGINYFYEKRQTVIDYCYILCYELNKRNNRNTGLQEITDSCTASGTRTHLKTSINFTCHQYSKYSFSISIVCCLSESMVTTMKNNKEI